MQQFTEYILKVQNMLPFRYHLNDKSKCSFNFLMHWAMTKSI